MKVEGANESNLNLLFSATDTHQIIPVFSKTTELTNYFVQDEWILWIWNIKDKDQGNLKHLSLIWQSSQIQADNMSPEVFLIIVCLSL